MTPVRAGMVEHPGEYQWSSYGFNGQGVKSNLIKPHLLYKKLRRTSEERQQAYRDMFRYELGPGGVDKRRKAANGNFACGDNRFNAEITEMLGRRVTPGKAGRAKKKLLQ